MTSTSALVILFFSSFISIEGVTIIGSSVRKILTSGETVELECKLTYEPSVQWYNQPPIWKKCQQHSMTSDFEECNPMVTMTSSGSLVSPFSSSPSHYEFNFNEQQGQINMTLKLKNVRPEESGLYLCTVSDLNLTSQISVVRSDDISSVELHRRNATHNESLNQVDALQVDDSSDTAIVCVVKAAYVTPTVKMFIEKIELKTADPDVEVEYVGETVGISSPKSTITLRHTLLPRIEYDRKQFMCKATVYDSKSNVVSSKNSTFNLLMRYKPIITDCRDQYSIPAGSTSFRITCTISAKPAPAASDYIVKSLTSNGIMFPPQTMDDVSLNVEMLDDNKSKIILTFGTIISDHYQEYQIVVSNSEGKANHTFTLVEGDGPPIVGESKSGSKASTRSGALVLIGLSLALRHLFLH